jgi:threonine dehydratase
MCNACWWLVVRLQQMLRLIELEKSVVEGGGAVGVAALLQEGLLPELRVR